MVAFLENLDDRNFFKFFDVPTLKLRIIILPTDQPTIILPTARSTKNYVPFALWWLFSKAFIQYNARFVFYKQNRDLHRIKKLTM